MSDENTSNKIPLGFSPATEDINRKRRWLLAFVFGIPLGYLIFFVLTWILVGPKDFDQFLVFHEIQYWNHALFGWAKQWTPVMCGGMSIAGEPQIPVMSLSMLISYLIGPFYGIKVACIIYLLIGWYGAYLYAGLCFRDKLIRALAASLFIGNGFFFYRLAVGHIDFVPFLVLPLALWTMHQVPHWLRSHSILASGTFFLLITIAYGAVIATVIDGSPVAIIHLLFWIGLYVLVLSVCERSPVPLLIFGGAVVVATFLDAGYLWPMLESQTEFPRLTANVFTDPAGLLIHALLPFRGKITHGVGKGHELTVYIGPVLAIFIWRYRRIMLTAMPRNILLPIVVVGMVSIIMGMGSLRSLHVPTWLSPFDLLRPLPGFRSIGVSARYWGFLSLPLSLLSAFALQRYVSEFPYRNVVTWLSIALFFQLGAQTEAFWSKWHKARSYHAITANRYFHGHPEMMSYVMVPDSSLQGEFITPKRGVTNCYDMDDFIHAPVRNGDHMIVEESMRGKSGGNLFEGMPFYANKSSPLVDFESWNHVFLHDSREAMSTSPDSMLTVVLNQAWNSHWNAQGCSVLRTKHNLLAVQCTQEQFASAGVNLFFHDELSSEGVTISRRAWYWTVVILGAGLLMLALSRRPAPSTLSAQVTT